MHSKSKTEQPFESLMRAQGAAAEVATSDNGKISNGNSANGSAAPIRAQER